MNLSISNIAWEAKYDDEMYVFLKEKKINGLEIAPTRIFQEAPYDHLEEAHKWAKTLKNDYHLVIPSMQSIWYGHTERIFGSEEERKILIDYTKKAILFAESIECKNLVFGNPKNRDTDDIKKNMPIALDFFKEIGDFAFEHHTCIALEANPPIYNTRFMNMTKQAVEMAYKVNSNGIKVNVDLGTILYNNERLEYLTQIAEYINHIHISEPGLKCIARREKNHSALLHFAKECVPDVFVSVEMGKQNIQKVKQVISYIKELSNE